MRLPRGNEMIWKAVATATIWFGWGGSLAFVSKQIFSHPGLSKLSFNISEGLALIVMFLIFAAPVAATAIVWMDSWGTG